MNDAAGLFLFGLICFWLISAIALPTLQWRLGWVAVLEAWRLETLSFLLCVSGHMVLLQCRVNRIQL